MPDTLSPQLLDQTLMEMRWRCLSLAADLDRLERCGATGDERLQSLREALAILLEKDTGRAERVQMALSDKSMAP